MSAAAFEMTVPVLAGDIDEQNHVNNTVYPRWVQDVAVAHWRAIASSKAPATLSDEIVLRTWVGKATRLTFERFTEIRRKSDGHLLSTARTLWCPINTQTSRPVRVPAEVRAQFST